MQIDFSLKPHVCVLTEAETQCHGNIVAEWKAGGSKLWSLCLYQDQQMQPLKCWQDSVLGSVEFPSQLQQNTVFELRDIKTQETFARETFEVVRVQKKYLHSRRNPWSFF